MKLFFLILIFIFSTKAIAFGPCLNDIKNYCDNQRIGKNRVFLCLQEQVDNLTTSCQEYVNNHKEKLLSKNPCFFEIIELCPDIKSKKKNDFVNCLYLSKHRLTKTCREKVEKDKAEILKNHPCGEELKNIVKTKRQIIKASANVLKNMKKVGDPLASRILKNLLKRTHATKILRLTVKKKKVMNLTYVYLRKKRT